MTNNKTTVRFAYAATNGETTRVRDFDGVETITVNTAQLRELYADVARLERQVQAAEAIMREVGSKASLRLVEALREVGNAAR